MEYSEFKDFFTHILKLNSLPPMNDGQIKAFYCFGKHLLEVNQITNLTAIRNLPDVTVKHFADSLLVAEHIPQGSRVLDLGCGAGFPSLPLAIARPDLTIIALDSTAKKVDFVHSTAKLLDLNNLTAIAGRAEDRTLSSKLGLFDIVTSRAVARLNVLCELCIPYVSVGGKLLALKAAKAEEELQEAQKAIKTLGGSRSIPYFKLLTQTDLSTEPRCIIEIQKASPTPNLYPRAYANILKKPL